jgi:hypothetical protein
MTNMKLAEPKGCFMLSKMSLNSPTCIGNLKKIFGGIAPNPQQERIPLPHPPPRPLTKVAFPLLFIYQMTTGKMPNGYLKIYKNISEGDYLTDCTTYA